MLELNKVYSNYNKSLDTQKKDEMGVLPLEPIANETQNLITQSET